MPPSAVLNPWWAPFQRRILLLVHSLFVPLKVSVTQEKKRVPMQNQKPEAEHHAIQTHVFI